MSKNSLVWAITIELRKLFFALTAQAIMTSMGYLLLCSKINFSIVFAKIALCCSTIPFGRGDSAAVGFTFISNISAIYYILPLSEIIIPADAPKIAIQCLIKISIFS